LATERSGSLTITDFDADAFEALFQPETGGHEVRVTSVESIACPSPWRHPIRWLRWNPLLRSRTTLVLPNCEVHEHGDGSVSLTPLLSDQLGPAPWSFTYEGEETR
jgi:hypothetical protein